jgi:TolB-like protein
MRDRVSLLFEDYVLDIERRELRRGAKPISVGPQVFDLLVYLIRNRDRVLSKDDLSQAIWGGRIVSESTLTSLVNLLRKTIGDSGEEQRLIRTVPRRGLRFVGDVRQEQTRVPGMAEEPQATPSQSLIAVPLPDRPSIAVLPFANMSGDPERDYFADGMTEDIITELSRMRWLFVIARNSTFTYKGRAVDVKQVGRELGVRYVLEGGVRQAGDRIRITAQLIDAATGVHLWADRFEGKAKDVFDLQDQVTASALGAIAPKLEQAEIERAKRKPTENLNAYDFFLRGMASFHRWTKEANSEALRLFYKAVELDPEFASAYGMAAWCYNQRQAHGWMTNRVQVVAEAVRLARQAVELGRDDAVALCTGGYGLARLGLDFEAGAFFIDRARTINPNLAAAWYFSGLARVHLGDPETAIAHLAHVMRLSPLDPIIFMMEYGMAIAHFIAGRTDEATSWAERALREKPNCHPALRVAAASHAFAGRLDCARNALARLRALDPALRISNLKEFAPFRRPEDSAKYEDSLRKAGLPE